MYCRDWILFLPKSKKGQISLTRSVFHPNTNGFPNVDVERFLKTIQNDHNTFKSLGLPHISETDNANIHLTFKDLRTEVSASLAFSSRQDDAATRAAQPTFMDAMQQWRRRRTQHSALTVLYKNIPR